MVGSYQQLCVSAFMRPSSGCITKTGKLPHDHSTEALHLQTDIVLRNQLRHPHSVTKVHKQKHHQTRPAKFKWIPTTFTQSHPYSYVNIIRQVLSDTQWSTPIVHCAQHHQG